MRNILSAVRRIVTWAGKVDAVPPLESLVLDPANARCSIVATQPRTLEAQGIDPESVFEEMREICPFAAAMLEVQYHCGLRAKESLCLRPGTWDKGTALVVEKGTKGGREREIPIETEGQRLALDRCAELVKNNPDASLGEEWGLPLHRAMNRLYYLGRKVGLTMALRGATFHGFRRSYAIRTYFRLSGQLAPVLGGAPLPRHQQVEVERELARRMGHKRRRIVAAYIGSHSVAQRVKRERLDAMLKLFGDERLKQLVDQERITRLLVLGGAADGNGDGLPELLAWEGADVDAGAIQELRAHLNRIVQKQVVLLPIAMVPPDMSSLDVF
jgi:hypothetical protein